MGRVLVIASQKGGVGKTTLALNISYALARRTWRTLLVDADPQGSIGYSIEGSSHQRKGLAEVLSGQANLAEAVVHSRLSEFDILPIGTVPPVRAFRWSAELEDSSSFRGLLDLARSEYDLVIIDTPPTMGGITLGAMRQADWVLSPLQAEPLAARSVRNLLEVLAELRDEGAAVRLVGLILTMLQTRNDSSLAIAEESWRLFEDLVFEATVPRDSVFLRASEVGTAVALLHRRPPAVAAVFDQIAAELELKMGLEVEDDQAIPLLG